MGESLVDRFELEGFTVDWFKSGEAAMSGWRDDRFDLVVSDVRLPGQSGEDVFAQVSERPGLTPPFIFITAFATVDSAVAMLKRGAADYITKPFDIAQLLEKVRVLVGADAPPVLPGDSTLGPSPAMRQLAGSAPRIAQRARIVLITGESGAGKEVLADFLHRLAFSDTTRPFVAVNCGAIAETLLEGEFFGYERGAFTGAERAHRGFFEQANGGTLFLDEIGDLPLSMQVKLLRVIQEQRVQRLGSERAVAVDVRLTFATNRDLQALVAAGHFREDLYYRINVVRLTVPPLRQRIADIQWLAKRFLGEQAARLRESQKSLSPAAQSALLSHDWPGNVRELKNRIERACVFSQDKTLGIDDLFEDRQASPQPSQAPTLETFMSEAEKGFIQAALQRHEGRVSLTAAELGVSRKTLWEKTRRHRLHSDESSQSEGDGGSR